VAVLGSKTFSFSFSSAFFPCFYSFLAESTDETSVGCDSLAFFFFFKRAAEAALDIVFELLALLKVFCVVETVFLSCQDVRRSIRMARLARGRGGVYPEFAFQVPQLGSLGFGLCGQTLWFRLDVIHREDEAKASRSQKPSLDCPDFSSETSDNRLRGWNVTGMC
jgi:hypothetical protein